LLWRSGSAGGRRRPDGAAAAPLPGFAWRIARLEGEDTAIDLELATAAGRVRLPIRIKRVELDDLAPGNSLPRRIDAEFTLADGGRGRLRLRGRRALSLRLEGIALPRLDRLTIAAGGIHALRGLLDLRLEGALTPRLRLDGAAVVHRLQLAPRIPVEGVDLSLPLPFALRALPDKAGETRIPISLRGSMEDPKLRTDRILSLVKRNLMPDALDGDARYYAVGFRSGAAVPTPAGEKMLQHLVRMLRDAGAVTVTLRGCVGKGDPSGKAGRRLAAARVRVVRATLEGRVPRGSRLLVRYPDLVRPSPDITGKEERVEVGIRPR